MKKVKISARTWKPHEDIAMCIKIYQDIQDMGQVMEARPPCSPVLLFLTKPGNEAAAPTRPHPHHTSKSAYMTKKFLSVILSEFTYGIQAVTDTKQFMNLGDPGIDLCIMSVKSWINAQVTMNAQISPVSPKSTSGIGRRPPSYVLHG